MKIQKQSPRGVVKKRCSENVHQIYRRIPIPKRDYNKVVESSPVNLVHILRKPFLKITFGWLLLKITHFYLEVLDKYLSKTSDHYNIYLLLLLLS